MSCFNDSSSTAYAVPLPPQGKAIVTLARLRKYRPRVPFVTDRRGRLSLQLKISRGLNKFHFCKASERYNSLPLWGKGDRVSGG